MREVNNPQAKGNKEINESFLRFLGLCRRAGKTVHGTALVCEALKGKHPPLLVIGASDMSDATKDRLRRRCAYYRVTLLMTEIDAGTLAHAVGKTCALAAIAVTDESFARQLCKIYAQGKASPENGDER